MPYQIEFTPDADEQFANLSARDRATLVDQLERQLLHEPVVETRNRKPMRPNPIAPWELRRGRTSYADQVRHEPMIVTDRGRPVMALLPIENADLETVTLSNDPRFIAMIERSRALYKPGSGIALEEIRRKYELQRKSRSKTKRRSTLVSRKGRSPRSR